MNTQSRAAIVRSLLEKEPWVEVRQASVAVGAHACRSVFDVWRELEGLSKRREEPPYWAAIWPGATLLATVLLNNPAWVRDRRVVDVGCGAGIGGIAAGKAGAASIIANDLDLYALEAARFNAALNGVTVQTVALDLTNSASEEWQASDMLLLSEMFYNAVAAEHMWAWLQRLRARGVSALLADAERPFFRTVGLDKVAQATLPVDYELEGVRERCVTVYAMNA